MMFKQVIATNCTQIALSADLGCKELDMQPLGRVFDGFDALCHQDL